MELTWLHCIVKLGEYQNQSKINPIFFITPATATCGQLSYSNFKWFNPYLKKKDMRIKNSCKHINKAEIKRKHFNEPHEASPRKVTSWEMSLFWLLTPALAAPCPGKLRCSCRTEMPAHHGVRPNLGAGAHRGHHNCWLFRHSVPKMRRRAQFWATPSQDSAPHDGPSCSAPLQPSRELWLLPFQLRRKRSARAGIPHLLEQTQ